MISRHDQRAPPAPTDEFELNAARAKRLLLLLLLSPPPRLVPASTHWHRVFLHVCWRAHDRWRTTMGLRP